MNNKITPPFLSQRDVALGWLNRKNTLLDSIYFDEKSISNGTFNNYPSYYRNKRELKDINEKLDIGAIKHILRNL